VFSVTIDKYNMNYYLYKTINLINGKYYYGKHSTDVVDDGYLGSGTILAMAIKKHGKHNFKREILEFCNDIEELNQKEKSMITESDVKSSKCYNIALGGQGGNLGPIVNKKIGKLMKIINTGVPKTDIHVENISLSKKGKKRKEGVTQKIVNTRSNWSSEQKQDFSKKMSNATAGENNGFHNKSHTDITKQKIRDTIGDSHKGRNNPNARPIVYNGVYYDTKKECAMANGLSKRQITKL